MPSFFFLNKWLNKDKTTSPSPIGQNILDVPSHAGDIILTLSFPVNFKQLWDVWVHTKNQDNEWKRCGSFGLFETLGSPLRHDAALCGSPPSTEARYVICWVSSNSRWASCLIQWTALQSVSVTEVWLFSLFFFFFAAFNIYSADFHRI